MRKFWMLSLINLIIGVVYVVFAFFFISNGDMKRAVLLGVVGITLIALSLVLLIFFKLFEKLMKDFHLNMEEFEKNWKKFESQLKKFIQEYERRGVS